MLDNKTKAVIIIITGAFIGGAISPVTKIGLLKIPPFTFSFIRFFISSLCLIPFLLKTKIKINKNFFILLLISVLPVINVAFFVQGVKLTTASIAQMLYGGTPVLAGIFSYIILKDRISAKKWLYITVGLVGVSVVVLLPLLQKNALFSGDIRGNLLITIGMILYSLYFVLSKHYQKIYSPAVITSVFIFLSTVIFFLLSLTEVNHTLLSEDVLNKTSVYALLYISILGTVGSYVLGQYAIKFGGPVLASFSLYLQPIFTYFCAFVLLGEKLTTGLLIGTILVFVSVALITYVKS